MRCSILYGCMLCIGVSATAACLPQMQHLPAQTNSRCKEPADASYCSGLSWSFVGGLVCRPSAGLALLI
jgi:hypothetical protein